MSLFPRLLLLTISIALLSACGWHLRGSGQSASLEQAIYLESSQGSIYQEIYKTLDKNQKLASINSTNIQLVLGEEYYNRHRTSVDNQAQTNSYQLTLSVPYEILDRNGDALTAPVTAELSRDYTFDKNNINSSDKEEETLRREMVRQIARQILQRVNFIAKKDR